MTTDTTTTHTMTWVAQTTKHLTLLPYAEQERLLNKAREQDSINDDLLAALRDITKRYTELASSGDCGFWDCEAEPEVIAARAAIARATA